MQDSFSIFHTNNQICKNCALYNKDITKCALTGRIQEDKDFCSSFKGSINRCIFCNRITLSPIVETEEDNTYILCKECANLLSTCEGCINTVNCAFENDSISIPKTITKQQQTPFGVQVIQVENPERINETCKKKCKCWDNEYDCCMREYSVCKEYVFNRNFALNR